MAKNKDPAVLFYTEDFLAGVTDLTMEERGQYITLLCLQHQRGHLSPKTIETAVPHISKDVLAKFVEDEEGNLFNRRMEEEHQKRKAYSESRRRNISARYSPPPPPTYEGTYEGTYDGTYDGTYGEMRNKEIRNKEIRDEEIEDRSISSLNIFTERFERFWRMYPRKVGKEAAEKAFIKRQPSEELVDRMISAISAQKRSEQWLRDNGRYIPYPATWLNQGRWEDEPMPEPIERPRYGNFDPRAAFEKAMARSYGEDTAKK